jgi:hypothetical protein
MPERQIRKTAITIANLRTITAPTTDHQMVDLGDPVVLAEVLAALRMEEAALAAVVREAEALEEAARVACRS